MRKTLKIALFSTACLVVAAILVIGVLLLISVDMGRHESLDKDIEAKMAKAGVPGLAVAFLTDGEIGWTGYYGYADKEARRKVTARTLFQMASTSPSPSTRRLFPKSRSPSDNCSRTPPAWPMPRFTRTSTPSTPAAATLRSHSRSSRASTSAPAGVGMTRISTSPESVRGQPSTTAIPATASWATWWNG